MTQVKLHLKKLGIEDHLIYLNPNDKGLSEQLRNRGLREPINSYYLSKLIQKNRPHVLDIGGNIGYFPIIEALSGASGLTVFEPVHDTYQCLVQNVSHFENVTCYNMAVAEKKGQTEIFVPAQRNLASFEPSKEYLGDHISFESQEVTCTTLTDVCEKLPKDNVLCRCDIEGYEAKVFKSIPQNVSAISLEFHTQILGIQGSIDFIDHLEEEGFRVVLMTRELEGLTNLFKKLGFWVFKAYNLLKEKRIYYNPTREEIHKVIKLQRENPHIYATRSMIS